jgi:alkylation response protein AidB-like acyl-CoA dehydrogenase
MGDHMSIVSIDTAAQKPTIDELVRAAREIGVFVRQIAEKTEADRRVSPEAIMRMRDVGLFRIMQPTIYGGYEYGFDALVRVVSAVGAGCGSTAWVFSLGIVHQWLIAAFSKKAQDEYWSNRNAIAFGSYPPVGKVALVDGGYRLTGSWSFTSGCDHADWLVLGGMIPPQDEAAPAKPTFFLVPIGDVVIDDNWFTMGLAGTGSKNVIGTDVFVPAHRVVAISDLLVGTAPGSKVHDNPLYRQSMLSALPFALVSPLLGAAEGGLADFLDMAKLRTTRGAVAGGNSRMAEFATIQSRVAEASGAIEAARLMMLDALQNALAAADGGRQANLDLRLRNRLSQAFSVKLLVQAIDALFQAAGGQGIFASKPIQRAWRDIHAGALHVSMNWDAVSTMYGQHALGLDPKGQY